MNRKNWLTKIMQWKEERESRTIGEAFAELRKLCIEENYTFAIPKRQNRDNPFED